MRSGMGPNYTSRTESGKPGLLSRVLAWHVAHDHGINDPQQAESRQQPQATDRERMPFGQRLGEVRLGLGLGWTQSMIAAELRILLRLPFDGYTRWAFGWRSLHW